MRGLGSTTRRIDNWLEALLPTRRMDNWLEALLPTSVLAGGVDEESVSGENEDLVMEKGRWWWRRSGGERIDGEPLGVVTRNKRAQ